MLPEVHAILEGVSQILPDSLSEIGSVEGISKSIQEYRGVSPEALRSIKENRGLLEEYRGVSEYFGTSRIIKKTFCA